MDTCRTRGLVVQETLAPFNPDRVRGKGREREGEGWRVPGLGEPAINGPRGGKEETEDAIVVKISAANDLLRMITQSTLIDL